jgi:hypothetical protein
MQEALRVLSPETIESLLQSRGCTTKVASGLYGSVLRACKSMNGTCGPPCVAVKTARGTTEEESIVHESNMLYIIATIAERLKYTEIMQHVVQFVASVTSVARPFLITEYVQGSSVGNAKNIGNAASILYAQTMMIVASIRKVVPGFVHGDLHANNMFIVQRLARHGTCRFSFNTFTEEGEPEEHVLVFRDKFVVKLIDFGLSECDAYKWESHPAYSGGLRGNWVIDAFLALEAFWSVADTANKNLLYDFCGKALGADIQQYLGDNTFDISRANVDMSFDTFLSLLETDVYSVNLEKALGSPSFYKSVRTQSLPRG